MFTDAIMRPAFFYGQNHRQTTAANPHTCPRSVTCHANKEGSAVLLSFVDENNDYDKDDLNMVIKIKWPWWEQETVREKKSTAMAGIPWTCLRLGSIKNKWQPGRHMVVLDSLRKKKPNYSIAFFSISPALNTFKSILLACYSMSVFIYFLSIFFAIISRGCGLVCEST